MPALSDWYTDICNKFNVDYTQKALSNVLVVKSKRRYNDVNRVLPGAVFIYGGTAYILRGRNSNGKYYTAVYSTRNFLAEECIIVSRKSLVYI